METVEASPTKQFFVNMLTRDIELTDAILDLLDNCLDGAVRSLSPRAEDTSDKYAGYWAKIQVSESEFMISDNCGGIPLEIARKYAFRMGRGPDLRDPDRETVGMYGIGMKRALFKIGSNSYVVSRHREHHFSVHIPPEWTKDDNDWTFPLSMEPVSTDETPVGYGTDILTTEIHEGVATAFSDPSFLRNLISRISEHYSLVIDRGFQIYVNDELVKPSVSTLLFDPEGVIRPAVFRYTRDGVDVFFVVGLNAPAEVDTETVSNEGIIESPMGQKRTYDDGGWTVYCNERAVLVRDKTIITGWGDGIAQYHAQFAVISGYVQFRAKDAQLLPVTTTKRGLDANSKLWMEVRAEMIKAIDPFIKYTNRWKNTPRAEQDAHFRRPEALSFAELRLRMEPSTEETTTRNRGLVGAKVSVPKNLPSPPGMKSTTRRVVYTRELSEIRELAEALFGDVDTRPGEVGDRCFSIQLELIRERG
jgi:hypothetical protein